MTKVLYPGSFDPITKGHMSVIEQASNLFDEVVVAILQNSMKKTSFFTLEERIEIIKELYKTTDNVKIVSGIGAAVDVAMLYDCQAIIRGLRNLSDFDYENQLSQINKDISNDKVKTICLFADREFQHVSSSVVKEILNLDKDITKYVDPFVKRKMLIKKEGMYNGK